MSEDQINVLTSDQSSLAESQPSNASDSSAGTELRGSNTVGQGLAGEGAKEATKVGAKEVQNFVSIEDETERLKYAEYYAQQPIEEPQPDKPDTVTKLPRSNTPKLILALQCCHLDMNEALDLIALIVQIEPEPRPDVEFVVMHSRGCPEVMAKAIADVAGKIFPTVQIISSKRFGTGWPAGCNDLWQDGMIQLAERFESGRLKARHVLTFEADVCPLRPDWLDITIAECAAIDNEGKECFGAVHYCGEKLGSHINGNAVFVTDMTRRHPEMQSSYMAWDVQHGLLTLKVGRSSSYVLQKYGCHDTLSVAQVAELRKEGVIPAFVHGIKKDVGRNAIRTMLADGSFAKRAQP